MERLGTEEWDAPLRSSSAPTHGTLSAGAQRRRAQARIRVVGGRLVEGTNDASFTQIARSISARARAVANTEGTTVALERRLSSRRESMRLDSIGRGAGEEGPAPIAEEGGEMDLQAEVAKLPTWRSTLTLRALVIGALLGGCFCIISLKLSLTTGVIPSLNIAAGLLGFFFLKSLAKGLDWAKLPVKFNPPLTAQEVTVIQTTCVACYGLAFNAGFGTYVLAMDYQSYLNVGDVEGNRPEDVVQPQLGHLMLYSLCISLFGVFMLVPVRKVLILDHELPYPSGTATGLMINSFFTTSGLESATRQIRCMAKWFCVSFTWDLFKWFFQAAGDCGTITGGFGSFPTFGIQAYNWTWNFDFQINYVGVGMLCPQIVTWSMMFGAIISWGIMWPLINNKAGDWYPEGLSSTDFRGLYGYKVFLSIAIMLVDGLYIVIKLLILTYLSIRARRRAAAEAKATEEAAAAGNKPAEASPAPASLAAAGSGTAEPSAGGGNGQGNNEDKKLVDESEEEEDGGHHTLAGETEDQRVLRRHVFMHDAIPNWLAIVGYAAMLAVAVGVIPTIYDQAKWYYVLVAGILSPILAFANAYGAGLTDWNMASLYGKLAIFIFAAWAGLEAGGVIAGLAVCGVVFASVSSASDLMQDFRTGYLTLSSPRAMFAAQLIGACCGVVLAPLCFWLFWSAFPIGVPGTLYFAPYGTVYRGMAIVGVEGVSMLPQNCLALCGGFAGITICMNLLRDFLPHKWGRFIPLPMCMALPFYLGAWLAVDMGVGAVIMLVWGYLNSADCQLLSAAAASGLIAGDGIWSIPSAILAIAGVNPPICMGWAKGSS
ncbi:putative metal-nicotianamine transporter YSL6 [Chlorella sorokiniana]|uniref:Metal-nicotianamine transporter YSL6 n=1 Tax=Chlorella sorokiniana TaxID=3076 RepID=A0A2P6U3B3_CHLSO|nr:putative metal-nicotianamine transporter YSL6 [Chlorella sorokiniana]|eukprot:PRW60807.1 putative metal-nicotianamine transporter YSL6 [Chlorella sorokiniana]